MKQRVVFYFLLSTLTLLPVFASVTIASAQPPGRQREEEEQKKKQEEEARKKREEEEQRKKDEERKKQEEEKRKKEDEERKKREEEAERQRAEARKREEEAQKKNQEEQRRLLEARKREEEAQKVPAPQAVKRTNVVEPPARQREKEAQKEEKSKETPPARQREENTQQVPPPPPPQKEAIVYYGSNYTGYNDTEVYVYGGPRRGVEIEAEVYNSGPHESSPAPLQITLGSFYTTGYWLSTTVSMQAKPYFLDLAYYEDTWRIKSVGVGMRNSYPLQGRLRLETGIGVYQTSGSSKASTAVTQQQVGLGGRIGLGIEERDGLKLEAGFRLIPSIANIKSQGVYLQAGKRF
jgi:actin-related protein